MLPISDLLTSVSHLSEEFEYLGFSPLPKYNPAEKLCDEKIMFNLLTCLVNTVWKFLQNYHVTLRSFEEKELKHLATFDENRCLQVEVERLKQKLSAQRKNVIDASDKDKELISKCESLCTDLRKEKDKVIHLKNKLQSQESQTAHQIKKKDNEITHLEEQLKYAISMKFPKLPDVKNLKPTDKETVYKSVICKIECNKQLLLQENLILHEALYNLHVGLESTVCKYRDLLEKYCKEDTLDHLNLVIPKVLPRNFKLPYEVVSLQLESTTHAYLNTLNTISTELYKCILKTNETERT